ncbi:unnamed protein product [Prunus armeniaca]
MRNWVGKRRVELPKSKGTQNWTFGNCIAGRGNLDEELGGQEKSRTTQEQENSKLDKIVNKEQWSWSPADGGRPATGGGGGGRWAAGNKGQRSWSPADGGRPVTGWWQVLHFGLWPHAN